MVCKKKEQVTKIIIEHLGGIYDKSLVELSKKLQVPVFVIISNSRSTGDAIIDELHPNLSKIKGISTIYPPEILFNDLAFFIGNVLHNSIDNSHLIISDKDKILKGGFDLKTSFRGR